MTGHKKRRALLVVGACLAGLGASPAGAETDAEFMERVRERYRTISTLEATFEQENDWDLLGEKAFYRGALTVSSDGRIRIEYSEPAGHVFVADGEWLWTYVPESGQVLKSSPGDDRTELSRLFLDFLAGHRVTDLTRGESSAEIALETAHTSSLRSLAVSIDTATGLGTRFAWTDTEGNTARYRFDSTRINQTLPEGVFDFEPPPGIDVVELGGGAR